jgi:hypothetical protein
MYSPVGHLQKYAVSTRSARLAQRLRLGVPPAHSSADPKAIPAEERGEEPSRPPAGVVG